jgi:hypothetical protein
MLCFIFACEAAGASSARHSLRPLIGGVRKFLANLGRIAPRECEDVFCGRRKRNSVVMPGLDPGIHPFWRNAFTKKMDHRVKPGDDELKSFVGCRRCLKFEHARV